MTSTLHPENKIKTYLALTALNIVIIVQHFVPLNYFRLANLEIIGTNNIFPFFRFMYFAPSYVSQFT